MQNTWIEGALGDQGTAALFGYTDELLLHILLIDVGEMHIVELHAPDLLELLLDATTGLQGIFQTSLDRIPVIILMRIEQL